MKLSEAFPSKYLKASDLKGRRVSLTVDSVAQESIGDDDKLVVYFEGKEKGLVLNKTNGATIGEIAGTEETDDWSGTKITLYPTRVDFQGKRVDCIRIEDPAPPAAQQSDAEEDTIPF